MTQPLVSIVTPSLNQGRFIRATIESVLSQDYPAIEYIIMDGGSTDETASVVKNYTSRVTWISECDRGQSHAINKGFAMAKGSILAWINSDDWILPGSVARAVAGFQAQPDAGAVYGEGYVADRDGTITGRFPFTEPPNLWKLMHLSDYILQQTLYIRRDALDAIGSVREDLHYAMDWDLLIRIAKRFPLHYIPEPMGCLREYPEAKSSSGGAARIAEIARVLREHTGMRFPPGYLLYALNAYRDRWCASIASPRLKWFVGSAFGFWIERLSESQGWRSDGSAGPRVKYMLPSGPARRVEIAGQLSDGQELRLISDKEIARREFSAGDFKWAVDIPPSASPVYFELRSSMPFPLRSIRAERNTLDP